MCSLPKLDTRLAALKAPLSHLCLHYANVGRWKSAKRSNSFETRELKLNKGMFDW